MYNQNSLLPQYTSTWNVLHLLGGCFPLESLSLRDLTFKLVTLIDLTTAQRSQTLAELYLDHMFIDSELMKCFKIIEDFSTRQIYHKHSTLVIF